MPKLVKMFQPHNYTVRFGTKPKRKYSTFCEKLSSMNKGGINAFHAFPPHYSPPGVQVFRKGVIQFLGVPFFVKGVPIQIFCRGLFVYIFKNNIFNNSRTFIWWGLNSYSPKCAQAIIIITHITHTPVVAGESLRYCLMTTIMMLCCCACGRILLTWSGTTIGIRSL